MVRVRWEVQISILVWLDPSVAMLLSGAAEGMVQVISSEMEALSFSATPLTTTIVERLR
jgi:hypothetical protein